MNSNLKYLLILFSFFVNHQAISQEIKMKTKKVVNSVAKYEIITTVPTCTDGRAKYFNKFILRFIDSTKNNFISKCIESSKDVNFPGAIESSLRIKLIDSFLTKEIISYCFLIGSYYSGAVHGFMRYKTFNYNLGKSSYLSTTDIISISDSSLRCILIPELLSKSDSCISNNALDNTTLKDMKINLSKDSVVFSFDDYEIASYACGTARIAIPKTRFRIKY